MQYPNALVFLVATATSVGPVTGTVQDAVTDALTGFVFESSDSSEELCEPQAALIDSAASPQIPVNECACDAAVGELTSLEGLAYRPRCPPQPG